MGGALNGEWEVTNHPPALSIGRRCSFCGNGGTRLESGGVRRYLSNGAKPGLEVPYGAEHQCLTICEGCWNHAGKLLGLPTAVELKRALARAEEAEAALEAFRDVMRRRDRGEELLRRQATGGVLTDVELDEVEGLQRDASAPVVLDEALAEPVSA